MSNKRKKYENVGLNSLHDFTADDERTDDELASMF